ncbi:YbdD/YjiX family protein [Nocardia cyriacigeorgica]|nr:YbdD/YjiX family protein [Nocardia cyriacigeorgica]
MGRIDREGCGEGARRGALESALRIEAAAGERLRGGSANGPGRTVLGLVRGVLWWFNSVLGGQDYQRYVAHLRRKHPGCRIPSEREYWRERHAEADRNPANRCC